MRAAIPLAFVGLLFSAAVHAADPAPSPFPSAPESPAPVEPQAKKSLRDVLRDKLQRSGAEEKLHKFLGEQPSQSATDRQPQPSK